MIDGQTARTSRLGVSWEGGVCRLALSDPDRLNPLNEAVRQALDEVFQDLSARTDVRLVVFTGEGRAFSAGADLDATAAAQLRTFNWAERRRHAGGWQRTLDALEGLAQVTIACLHGWTVGGAALLAASCDIRIGTTDLRVSIPELKLGIPLTWAGLPRLVREIGLARARDLVMTGRVLRAEEALDWGFITRLVEPHELDAASAELVASLLEMPEAPLALTRDALAAIGRSHPGFNSAWADADLLAWSLQEPEATAAAERYQRQRVSGGRSRNGGS